MNQNIKISLSWLILLQFDEAHHTSYTMNSIIKKIAYKHVLYKKFHLCFNNLNLKIIQNNPINGFVKECVWKGKKNGRAKIGGTEKPMKKIHNRIRKEVIWRKLKILSFIFIHRGLGEGGFSKLMKAKKKKNEI